MCMFTVVLSLLMEMNRNSLNIVQNLLLVVSSSYLGAEMPVNAIHSRLGLNICDMFVRLTTSFVATL